MISRQQMMAGKIFKDKLNRILVLSPLPIETQHTPYDGAHIVKAKTDVYLDIGYNNICEGEEGLALSFNCFNLFFAVVGLSFYFLFSYNIDYPIFFMLSSLTGTHVFLFFYMYSTFLSLKKYRFIRFNRQRREVALPFGVNHEYVIVPWEKLYAWAQTSIITIPPSETLRTCLKNQKYTDA